MSASLGEVQKYAWLHNHWRTDAMVSETVACGLAYPAVRHRYTCPVKNRCCASKGTMVYSPNRQGVVRAMAWSDHGRWVSRRGGHGLLRR